MATIRAAFRWRKQLILFAAALCLNPLYSVARQESSSSQAQDSEYARLVRQWTTASEFLSPLVDHLPKAEGVPSPKEVLGHYIGAPKKLAYYEDIVRYFDALASKSPRVRVMTIGKTDEGRDCIVAAIGSEEAIRDLEVYRGYLARLADPRGLSEAEAMEIIRKAKPIYHLMGGLHSSETGPPEMLMELAYRLAVENSPLIDKIRDNVIVTIFPVAEPDGRDRYVDWYYKYLIDIDDENDRIPGPPYWGKYVLHDNNRDIFYSQMTTRNLLEWYLRWHPPIMHDLHESVPFMYTFSGQAPQNPTLDPILYGELPWFANFEMAQMIKYGMPGVWTHAFVDMWSPGYLGYMASNHNGMLRMYETFGNGGATTMKRTLTGRSSGQTKREWYRPLPPYKEVEWSMRNNINYMETGVLSALELTAAFPQEILDNFYRKSLNSIESGKKEPPYGFVIPAGQRDMTRVALTVNLLRRQGIEVGRATGEIKLEEGDFPAGSYVVKRDQPYGRLAKILLEKQDFPDPSLRTYDDTGWTMGLMTGTEVAPTEDKSVLDVPVEAVQKAEIEGKISGTEAKKMYAVADFGSNNMIVLRYRLKDLEVLAAEKPFKADGVEFPAGSFLIPLEGNAAGAGSRIGKVIRDLGLTAAADPKVGVSTHEVDVPRLAVYSTWGSTQEVGWVRYALDRFGVDYDLIFKERVKQGNLRSSYDVIVMPSQGGSAKRIVFGIAPQEKPIPYTRTEEFKNLGMYGESSDITGGMGLEGAAEFQKFVEQGGVLITLGSASYFPPDFGLTRDINAGRASSRFYAPGPIIQAEILHPSNPIFYGYDKTKVPVRYANGPLLQVPEKDKEKEVLMKFPGGEKSVLSGLMRNPNEIKDRPAVVEVASGKGRVLLFATNPCYRWENHVEFNMLFNAILNYNDEGAPEERTETGEKEKK